jgi:hypothetical protein
MSRKYYKSREFRELQKEWYDKLADDGFEDIEWIDHKTGKGQNSRFLKNSSHHCQLSNKILSAETLSSSKRFKYYRIASHFLHNYNKFNDLDDCAASKRYQLSKTLWEMHTDGATYRKISRSLRELTGESKLYSVYWVYYRIRKLQKIMIDWNGNDPKGLRDRGESGD